MRGNYDGSLRRGSAGSKIVEKQSARSAHPNVSDGNANQSKADQSKVAKMALSGLAPVSDQKGGFADQTAAWTVAMSERRLPRTDLKDFTR